MNKEDFIKQRIEIDHITRETFNKTYLVIPCNCGAIYCHGYKCLEKNKIDEWLLLYIEDLQKKAEQGEHYKHLYSEVKKQKDNGIKYIRENVYIDYYGMSLFREKDGVDKLLRMLGEKDV